MTAPRRAAFAGTAAAVVLAACAPAPITPDTPRVVRDQVVAPYDVREVCLRAAPGERIEFAFEASDPVDFSLHYRDGNGIVTPIVRAGSRGDAGYYAPRFADDYCLSWEAGASGAFIDYRIGLSRERF